MVAWRYGIFLFMFNSISHSFARFNILASVKVKCVDIIYSCLEKGCQKSALQHPTRWKGTAGNDKFKGPPRVIQESLRSFVFILNLFIA